MNVDGANLGIGAGKALGIILGNGEQPAKEDIKTPEQVREDIMSAPEDYEEGKKSYEEAACWLAKQ